MMRILTLVCLLASIVWAEDADNTPKKVSSNDVVCVSSHFFLFPTSHPLPPRSDQKLMCIFMKHLIAQKIMRKSMQSCLTKFSK